MVLTSNMVLLTFILCIYMTLQTCWIPLVICAANCWPEDHSQIFSTMKFELWRTTGPSLFQLQRNMLKSGKIRY